MPREFKPIVWTQLTNEHVGQRFWIVPNDRLKLAGLTGKPVPEDKKKPILLLSGVFKGHVDGVWGRPIFAEFQNKDDAPVKKTAGTYPHETLHTYFYFEPVEIGSLATTVKKENIVRTLGVSANMLEEGEGDAGAGAGAGSSYSREQRISTDLLLDTLILGENKQTVKQILMRASKPDLSVVRQMPVSQTAALQLLPEGKKEEDLERIEYITPTTKYGPSYRYVTTVTYFKDCIGLLMDSDKFTEEQKTEYYKLFVANGANPSVSLTLAVANLNVPVVRMLLEAGADSNTVTKYFWKTEEYFTTPVKAVIPQTLITKVHSVRYIPIDKETQMKKWKNMEVLTEELLKARDFVEQDGKLAMVEPDQGTLTIEPFISLPMLQELRGRVTRNLEETERVRQIQAGPNSYEKRVLEHITWYQYHGIIIGRILAKLEEISTRQRSAPGGNLAEQARLNAVAHGFRNETRNNRRNHAFASYAERNAMMNGNMNVRSRKGRKSRKSRKNRAVLARDVYGYHSP